MVNIFSLLNFNAIQFLFVTHRLNPGGGGGGTHIYVQYVPQ